MSVADTFQIVQVGAASIAMLAILLRWSAGDVLPGGSLGGISISFFAIATLAALIVLATSSK